MGGPKELIHLPHASGSDCGDLPVNSAWENYVDESM